MRAIASAPEVLICDESTAALDVATEEHVINTSTTRRHRHGTPVLLINPPAPRRRPRRPTLTLSEGQLR